MKRVRVKWCGRCEKGWLNVMNGAGNVTAVAPCPSCRPALAKRLGYREPDQQRAIDFRERAAGERDSGG